MSYGSKCNSNCNYRKGDNTCGKLFGVCPMTTKKGNEKVTEKNKERGKKNEKREFKFF